MRFFAQYVNVLWVLTMRSISSVSRYFMRYGSTTLTTGARV